MYMCVISGKISCMLVKERDTRALFARCLYFNCLWIM